MADMPLRRKSSLPPHLKVVGRLIAFGLLKSLHQIPASFFDVMPLKATLRKISIFQLTGPKHQGKS
jgi:hypothetical protein